MPDYRICTIEDMFAVPAEERPEMLRDLELWLAIFDPVAALRHPAAGSSHKVFIWGPGWRRRRPDDL